MCVMNIIKEYVTLSHVYGDIKITAVRLKAILSVSDLSVYVRL